MTCDEAREAFSELYDGILSGSRLVELSRHLDGCAACRAEWDAFRMTVRGVAGLGLEEPPLDFAVRVRQQVKAPPWWTRAAHAIFVPLRVKIPIHAAALVVLALAGLLVYQRTGQPPRPAPPRAVAPAPSAPPAPAAAPAPVEAPAAPATASKSPVAGGTVKRIEPAPPPPFPTVSPKTEAKLQAPSRIEKAQQPAARVQESAQAERRVAAPDLSAGPSASEQAKVNRLQTGPPPPPPMPEGMAARAEPAKPVGTMASAPPAAGSADTLFSEAMTAYVRQEYEKSIEDLRAFLTRDPTDRRAADARFFLAEAYFAIGRYADAVTEYGTFLRDYPGSPKVPQARFREGTARLAAGDRSGCQTLREALERYPRSREAAAAKATLAAHCP